MASLEFIDIQIYSSQSVIIYYKEVFLITNIASLTELSGIFFRLSGVFHNKVNFKNCHLKILVFYQIKIGFVFMLGIIFKGSIFV